jgi:hypothetical protein
VCVSDKTFFLDVKVHRQIMLKQLASTGLILLTYTSLHLGGHFLAPFSFKLANAALRFNRIVFQNPVVELGMGMILVGHVALGLQNMFKRNQIERAQAAAKRKKMAEEAKEAKEEISKDINTKTKTVDEGTSGQMKASAVKQTDSVLDGLLPAKTALQMHRMTGIFLSLLVLGLHIPFTRIFPTLCKCHELFVLVCLVLWSTFQQPPKLY